jgi:hypothetical protein
LQLLKKETEFYEKYGSMNVCYDFFHPKLVFLVQEDYSKFCSKNLTSQM